MAKITRLKARAYLFEEESLIENLTQITFATNKELILNFQFKRSSNKLTPSKKFIGCTDGPDKFAKCSGLVNCPDNCILFAVKKPWLDGGYKDGLLTDKSIRNNITRLIDSWETLKKSKNKDSKAAEKSREEFKKKGEQVFWIGKDNVKEILKKTSVDKLSYYVDIKFLKDQKSSRLMTLGSKNMRYKTVNKDKKPLKTLDL
ncbi:uncharacterized protein LOC136082581 [Hydra vulgaris]|uniref:uncharacterized protein LOC136082581 n=1 Tax=Hydra vulgaris TaxID=6087 RepID=UPI0032EA81E5